MENWKTHFLSFLVISAFLIVALASDDDSYITGDNPCWDRALVMSEPLPPNNGHSITYQVKVIDKETNQPLPDITVEVDAISYHCLALNACPDKCYMKSDYERDGQFIGITNANGVISRTIPNWQASDQKDRMKLIIKVKDENLLQYAYRRKDILVGQNQTEVSITMALIKDLL